MHPLHTIPHKAKFDFHPVETELIRKLEVRERSVSDTYKSLIENTHNLKDKNRFKNIMRNHLLAWDFWKHELENRETTPIQKPSVKTRFYGWLVKMTSVLNRNSLFQSLKRLELLNLKAYSKILKSRYVGFNLKHKIRKYFIQNSKTNILKINFRKQQTPKEAL